MTLSPVAGLTKWNWDGDCIVHDCVVPSGRPAVGHIGKRYEYPIDVREFLVAERNEVLRETLKGDLVRYAALCGVQREQLESREAGTFDLRAAIVSSFVAERVEYRLVRSSDYWQFPDETLFLRSGDCEDRALLIAALLIAAGVSAYNVRVALGQLRVKRGPRSRPQPHDHAWVMYKNEAGRWMVIEPSIARRTGRGSTRQLLRGRTSDTHRAEYVPYYLFNDTHLWRVTHVHAVPSLGEIALRRNWSRLRPEFAGEIHRNILTQALSIPECPGWFLQSVTSHFSTIAGQVIDPQDNFVTHGYDCRDHFDDGFIDEGWALVRDRLAKFKSDNVANIDAFAKAAHGIADFYAHSSYAHFADVGSHEIPPYDPAHPIAGFEKTPKYSGGDFDLTSDTFSTGPEWEGSKAAAAAAWDGKILSGRYAQHGDSHSIIEALTPTPPALDSPGRRAAAPHHDEIAVDGTTSSNKLYVPVGEYHRQFVMRQGAAIAHVRSAFKANWSAQP